MTTSPVLLSGFLHLANLFIRGLPCRAPALCSQHRYFHGAIVFAAPQVDIHIRLRSRAVSLASPNLPYK